MLSVENGSYRQLKSLGWGGLRLASLSPDGRWIAYSTLPDAKAEFGDVFVLASDGTQETAVAPNPASDDVMGWSPDGSRLYFVSNRTGTFSLWSIGIESGRAKGSPELVKADIGAVMPTGITRAGALYYYVPGANGQNSYAADLRDGKAAGTPALATERFVNTNTGPAVSPDGKSLAYYSQRPGQPSHVVIRTLDTGEERDVRLKMRAAIFWQAGPAWLPDGRSLLVTLSEAQRPGFGFYRLDLASGNTELVHRVNSGIQGLAMAPDGKAVFYTASVFDQAVPRTRMIRYDLETHQERELRSGDWMIEVAVPPIANRSVIWFRCFPEPKAIWRLCLPRVARLVKYIAPRTG